MAHLTRRHVLAGAAATGVLGALPSSAQENPPRRYSSRARSVVEGALVIDMLGVLGIDYRPEVYARPLSAEAIADFRASGINVFHHSVGTMGPSAREDTFFFMAESLGLMARHSDIFVQIDKSADLTRAKRAGKIGVILGVQNAEHFTGPDDVRLFHALGLRCSQLTYNAQNTLGSGSTERVDGGVTDYGASIVTAMNEVGMLVDVSHCGPRTTLDAIEVASKPIAITHSNCRALVDHPRNKTDEAIRALAARGGVMGITGVRNFVSLEEPTAVPQIVDHIDHVVQLVGVDHVGIGSDADLYGYDDLPDELRQQLVASYSESYAFRGKIDTDGYDHPRKIFDLTEELIRRNYSNANIAAILGGNFQRLLTQVWG